MPARSKSQQKIFGMAYAYLKGELPDASDEVKQLAKSLNKKKLKDFAKTKHKGLPNKVKKKKKSDLISYLIKLANHLDSKRLINESDLVDKIITKISKDLIPGGNADNIPLSKFNDKQLAFGVKEELEHTSSKEIAQEIARDHLTEDPNYYSHLEECGLTDE